MLWVLLLLYIYGGPGVDHTFWTRETPLTVRASVSITSMTKKRFYSGRYRAQRIRDMGYISLLYLLTYDATKTVRL